jgi:hypothetical protein
MATSLIPLLVAVATMEAAPTSPTGTSACDLYVAPNSPQEGSHNNSSSSSNEAPVAVAAAAAAAAGEASHVAADVVSSLLSAQDAVRARLAASGNKLRGDIVVCLGPGTHTIGGGAGGPLSLGGRDATRGAGRVVWRGLGGGESMPTVVTGGVQVTGWKEAAAAVAPGVFSAPVPAGAAGLAAVRQLWVKGLRANRTTQISQVNCSAGCVTPSGSKAIQCAPGAKAPHACPASAPICVGFKNNVQWGHCEHCVCKSENALPLFTPWVSKDAKGTPTAVGFTTSGGSLPGSWANTKPNTIEFVWPIVIRNWIEPRCTVASVVGNNITLASPCGLHLFQRHGGAPPAPGRIEAAPPPTGCASKLPRPPPMCTSPVHHIIMRLMFPLNK